MDKARLKLEVALLMALRSAISDYLPVRSNLVILDILMFVLTEHLQERPLTVKRLFRSLDLSHTGFRYHFKKLVDNDWVHLSRITEENTDQRLRFITPSDKLISRILLITDVLDGQFEKTRNSKEPADLLNWKTFRNLFLISVSSSTWFYGWVCLYFKDEFVKFLYKQTD